MAEQARPTDIVEGAIGIETFEEIAARVRPGIDECDENIAMWIIQRFGLTEEVGIAKDVYDVDIQNRSRELEVLDHVAGLAEGTSLNPKFMREIFELIMSASRRQQAMVKSRSRYLPVLSESDESS